MDGKGVFQYVEHPAPLSPNMCRARNIGHMACEEQYKSKPIYPPGADTAIKAKQTQQLPVYLLLK